MTWWFLFSLRWRLIKLINLMANNVLLVICRSSFAKCQFKSFDPFFPCSPHLEKHSSGGKCPDLTVKSLGSWLTLPWISYVNFWSSWLICFHIYRMWDLPLSFIYLFPCVCVCVCVCGRRTKVGNKRINTYFLKKRECSRRSEKIQTSDLQLFASVPTLTHKVQ